MKILLILPPTAEKPEYREPPLGLLYVGSALTRNGYKVDILDLQLEYISLEKILMLIKKNNYEVIGFGGISTCYGYVKEASKLIKDRFPHIHLIAGGILSSTYDLLLKNTPIEVICMKEGEITGVNIINRLNEGKEEFEDIKGVAFKKDNKILLTAPQPYIDNLDDIPIPNYDLLDMSKYLTNPMEDKFFLANKECRRFYRKGMHAINMKTSRGCINACTFCYRHFKGHRQHSVRYVIEHIKYLQSKFNIYFVRFGDELFTQNRQWVIDFCTALVKESIHIYFIIHGVRTDNVDLELMQYLKKAGCVTVFVGFESGSQIILDEMRKNISVEKNIEAIKTIKNSGVDVLTQIVIGMPTETTKTIEETKDALLKTGVTFDRIAIGYAQAYPMTWLWNYALRENLINDPEDYLEKVGKSTEYLLNYTKAPFEEWRRWKNYIYQEVIKNQFKNRNWIFKFMMIKSHKFRWAYIYWKRYGIKMFFKKAFSFLLKKITRTIR